MDILALAPAGPPSFVFENGPAHPNGNQNIFLRSKPFVIFSVRAISSYFAVPVGLAKHVNSSISFVRRPRHPQHPPKFPPSTFWSGQASGVRPEQLGQAFGVQSCGVRSCRWGMATGRVGPQNVACRAACRAIPCRAVPCCATPCHGSPCRAVPWWSMPSWARPGRANEVLVMECRALPCRDCPCSRVRAVPRPPCLTLLELFL